MAIKKPVKCIKQKLYVEVWDRSPEENDVKIGGAKIPLKKFKKQAEVEQVIPLEETGTENAEIRLKVRWIWSWVCFPKSVIE